MRNNNNKSMKMEDEKKTTDKKFGGRNKSGRNSGKSKGNRKPKSKEKTEISDEQKTNNPAWYSTNEALLRDAASVPFSTVTGENFRLWNQHQEQILPVINRSYNSAMPGIAVFDIVPTFGNQISKDSSLNVAAQAIYTWVRYYNAGSKNYGPADLMMYLIANAQIYSLLNWAMRIYGTIKQYDWRNKYLSRALIEAMNVDYEDILGNMAQYRAGINMRILKAASFAVPEVMTYFPRVASMYTDIYTDGETIKDQLYMYNPVGFYRYHFDESSTRHDGPYLMHHTMTSNNYKMKMVDIFQYIDDTIGAIFDRADIGVISGDVYKAYQGKILTLMEMDENYTTNIVHDDWVLNQMKNATIMSAWHYPDLYDVPDQNYLRYDPTFHAEMDYTDAPSRANFQFQVVSLDREAVLTVPNENPDFKQVGEYTRLMAGFTSTVISGSGASGHAVVNGVGVVGTEIVLRARFLAFENNELVNHNFWNYARRVEDDGEYRRSQVLRRYFKYFPATLSCYFDASGAVMSYGLDLDVDNYALISMQTLKNIHDVAILNMFATQAIAQLK